MNKSENPPLDKTVLNSDIEGCSAAIITGRQESIKWEDIERLSNIFPELEKYAKDIIEGYLGYLPTLRATVSFEPFIRVLFNQFLQGQISENQCNQEIYEIVKLVRNTEMQIHLAEYPKEYFEQYDKIFGHFGLAARDRISRFLGYEPKLEHSIVAELWLRKILATDTLPLPDFITPLDYKVITLIKYREILFSEGKIAADSSPLIPKCNNIS